MWIIGQSGYNGLDCMGFDITQNNITNDNNEIVGHYFALIGLGFGNHMQIAEYPTLEQASILLNDIFSELSNGEQFYDIRERQNTLGILNMPTEQVEG